MGAGGTPKPRPRREEALKERAKQRERELKASAKDYVTKVPVRIGVDEAGVEDEEPNKGFSVWDWANRRVCQVCSRKPIARVCGKCDRLLCGFCTIKESGRHRWVCPDCASPSEQAQLLVEVLNEEVGDRTPIIPRPPSMAKRLVGSRQRLMTSLGPLNSKQRIGGCRRVGHTYQ